MHSSIGKVAARASLLMRYAVAVTMTMSLCGCIGIAVHVIRHMQKSSSPHAKTATAQVPASVRKELDEAISHGAPGVTAIVMRNGKPVFRIDVGSIAHDTQLPVASASKWMTAALVMTVVDDGKLSLDAPISRYLPEFRGIAATITLRELLAQTSGDGSLEDGVDIRQDARITLAESALDISRRPLTDPPGNAFRYGGPGFQVAGAAVEAVTRKRWAALFDERIARPLGMSHTYWTHLPSRGVLPAQTLNPLLQGGVVTTADDYMRFLSMLAQNGRIGDRQILSAQSVEAMETAQTIGKPMLYRRAGTEASPKQYALGNWCETWDADRRCLMVSSPGAFGTFPWIDRRTGLYGVFFTRARLPEVLGNFDRARAAIMETYATR